MSNIFPAFCTSLIGSMPRSKRLLQLKQQLQADPTSKEVYEEALFNETKAVVEMQLRSGIDVPVSGELDRDNFVSYVAEHVAGVELMSMNQILDITTDADSFKESLNQMDASDNSMSNPICVGKIDTEAPIDTAENRLMQQLVDGPYKITIPSPYILTRSMWLKEVSRQGYANRKELGADVVKLLIGEVKRLASAGAKVIQIDEPILSEVVFTHEGDANSFY